MGSCNMFLLKPTIFAIFAILVSVQADQSWYSFRTTFSPTGFPDRQPWLQSEAEDRGWVKVSDDCSEGSSFPGFRYAPPGDNPEMVVIYDVNGFIAGMHSIVAKKFISMANNFNFAGSNWYRSDNSWVKTCTLQQLTSWTLPAFAKVVVIKLLFTSKELVTVFGSKMVQQS